MSPDKNLPLSGIADSTKRESAPPARAVVAFAITMFVSAALLFLMEPMFAKMVLPLLGGTPAVWNTCLVFFQAVLLAGYAYAHVSAKLLSRRGQIGLHLAVLLAAVLILPLGVPRGWAPPTDHDPAGWLLLLLVMAVGAPFFALSASTPILQKWFSYSGHPSAADPYFLYAASNSGSLLGLLAYPLLLEPLMGLTGQSRLWAWCYGLFLLMVAACVVLVWGATKARSSSAAGPMPRQPAQDSAGENPDQVLNRRQRFRWVMLAFVPSSLMLGVTSLLTTYILPIPLLWVLPLAVYLLSFVLVFARKPVLSHQWLVRRLPYLILGALLPIVAKGVYPLLVMVPFYLLTLFAVAMVCHGEIARSRPSARRLTEFYLWISVGGVLGGIFSALIAPLIFNSLAEVPVALVLAAALRPPIDVVNDTPRARRLDLLLPIALGASMVAVIFVLQAKGLESGRMLDVLIFGYSMVWCLRFAKRPLRFALGVAAFFLASHFYAGPFGHTLGTERSFFGVYRIADNPANRFRILFNGGTEHGIQSLDAAQACTPLAYYTRSGPIGQLFAAYAGSAMERQVAIIGLGAGDMAAYETPGEQFTFYEIDPLVERIAEDRRYFTFISNCASQVRVVLGDARLRLRDAADHRYGIMVLDAFGGDSIPVHLLTREAVRLYLRKLAPGGVLAFHLSNRYLYLGQVVGNLAQDAGLECRINVDSAVSQSEARNGKLASAWAVMARKPGGLAALADDPRWEPCPAVPGARVWTDDFSSVVSIIRLH